MVYLAVIFCSMFLYLGYFPKKDPELLERRMRTKEKEPEQRRIIAVMTLCFLLTFLLPGFNRRFGWSDVPLQIKIASNTLVFLGCGFIFLVLRENS